MEEVNGTAEEPPPRPGGKEEKRPRGTEPGFLGLEEPPGGWTEVGRLDELEDGERLRVLAGSTDLAVFRAGGEVFAVDNRCPHRGGPLSEGPLQGASVTCPLHFWRFDLRTGLCPDRPGASVRTYQVKVEEDGRILVRIPHP
jgi:nitrite reductase (NADH) small subunit